ncbi:Gfo/Idh/MocA family protein [Pararhizobium mangrovi]|uniref:Gfo/Idh/MocA family oxidoreductase n=1 Tax=Pararhizobium mangrovi TaxID=2590452 RepID=A0A506U4L2_9HYPH|nr:Gfo/Idh/MocA family oxidoreductase [Pararhizobium mangrovi]TPW27955.1 Gfo/Idh/MocA family oxidoreductase [Pararhizobium mangrovi]
MASQEHPGGRRIRLGMVGGGQGAFIGAVHRIASRLDDRFELVAGALSSDPDRAAASAAENGISADRSYTSYIEMAKAEAARADGIEVVSIVTPNHLHASAAKAFLNAGIHVICDKPMTVSVSEAEELVELVRSSGKLFILTHNYTAYPMIRQARAMVRDGAIGQLRVVKAEYAQDWLAEKAEETGVKQAEWRTDPERSGAGGAIGDIGTHAYNLAAFVTGELPNELCAELSTFVEGRRLDDNVQILMRYESGARGMLWASQVAVGNENGLALGIYGSRGGLEWSQEHPNHLWYAPFGEEKRLITRGGAGMGEDAGRFVRVPAGHPEGYLEGFANLYSEAAQALFAAREGKSTPGGVIYPTVEDGLDGMKFIATSVESSKNGSVWTKL